MKTAEEYEAKIAELLAKFVECRKEIDEAHTTAKQRIVDLERSAASAREIARVAMTHTGTRAIRVCVENTDFGISVIVCDPAGNEVETAAKVTRLLDASLWAHIGVRFTDEPGTPIGSSA